MKNISAGILWATAALAAVAAAEPARPDAAQPVTTEDYARAERFLAYNTAPLVLYSPGPATWLSDGTAWYSMQTAQGITAVLVDPARRTREAGSPRAKQAAAPAAPVDPSGAPSPDGKLVAFIRADNLWVREAASGKEKHLQLLTPENATHEVSLAPSGRYFIDSYSTPDTPPITVLRDGTGKRLLELEKADVSGLTARGWVPPTLITVKARDGSTDLHGLMFKPTHFDAARRYPIVNEIYPGPQVGSVNLWSDKQQWKFAASRGDAQSLAELGFIVVAIDGMGTELRSRRFHDAYYGDMGDNTLLIDANRNFDLIMLPNQNHEYAGRALVWMTRQRWDYFVRNLLGAQPPPPVAP
jgi:hypothetical protein